MPTISITNLKEGAAKTNSAINLGAGLRSRVEEVFLVMCRQKQVKNWKLL